MSEHFSEFKINNTWKDDYLSLRGIRLIQVGRYYCQGGRHIRPHLHANFFELTLATDGLGTIIINNHEMPIKSGDIYISFPYDKHEIISDESHPLKYDHIAFIVENPEFKDSIKYMTDNYYDAHERVFSDSRINRLVSLILSEFNTKSEYYNEVASDLLNAILVYIIRIFKDKNHSDYFENVNESEILCNQIMNYIDMNIFDIESLTVLTNVINYNYSYLSTLFKNVTKMTLREYFTNRKLEVAKLLIEEGKLKIYEIANKLHYSSPNAFTKAYKNKYGVPPTVINYH